MAPEPAQSDTSAARKVDLIVAQLDALPTLPRIASQLLRLTRSDQATTRQVIELIKQDQAVTAKILSLARRAGSGIRGEVTTIDKCVLLMGLEAVRGAALSVKIFEIFDPAANAAAGQFNLAGFWTHSLAVALACEKLAAVVPAPPGQAARPSGDDLFVAGLLHDIGKAALHHCLPKSYAKVIEAAESTHSPLVALERKLIGIDHAVVGKRLAQRWQLPPGVIDAIWLHHTPPAALPETVRQRGFAQVVFLGDALARELRLGYSGNHSRVMDSAAIAEQLGLNPAALDDVRRWLPNELANRAGLIGLDQLDSRDLYHQALRGANEELSRLYGRLLDRGTNLATKAKYFDLLAQLNHGLVPGGRAMDIAELFARLFAPLVGSGRVVVFSEPPADAAVPAADPPIEGVAFDPLAPDSPERFLLDPAAGEVEGLAAARRAGWFDVTASADSFAVYPVAGHLGWVHQQLAQPMPLESLHLMPLIAYGRWVGGVIFAAPPGQEFLATWPAHRSELYALATAAGLAARAAQLAAAAEQVAEELAQSAEVCARLTDQLVRDRAMASVGIMAAGAGHELNNPLMVISGRSELLAAEEADPKRREALEQIRNNAQRASGIITDLMNFARPPQAKPERIDLVQFARTLAEPFHRSGIAVTVQSADDLPAVWADPMQMQEAVQEVLDNAQQAMAAQDSNKNLLLTVGRSSQGDGPELELTVCDTGVGMEPFVLEHATDPFFSARPAGRGRGLGLSRARRLIEHNGGSIQLESQPGVGTTVRIRLPAVPIAK